MDEEDDFDGSPTTTTALTASEALLVVLALIGFTILFEKMKHSAEHAAGRALRPIVEALFGELTVLGFLSTITYCMERMGVFEVLSDAISGDEEEGEEHGVFELVETIHFGMFGVMVIFLISILCEVYHGLQSQKEWIQWDRACNNEAYVKNLLLENAKLDEEYENVSAEEGYRGVAKRAWRGLKPYLSFMPFLRDERRELLEDKMEFCSLRGEFFKERSVEPPFAPAEHKTLGDQFNFGRYITFAYAKKMAHIVEIEVQTWIFFAGGAVCYFLLLFSFGFSLKALAWCWLGIGWIFHVLAVKFEMYLLGIRDRFLSPKYIPKPKLRELSWHCLGSLNEDSSTAGTEKEPLKHNNGRYKRSATELKVTDGLPMWCHIDLKDLDQKRGAISKYLFGPTPSNRQLAVYKFGGQHANELHLLCLQIMLVFSCVYSTQLAIFFVPLLKQDEGTSNFTFITYCVLASIPALAFIFNKKRLIASLVQAGCIGPFVLPQAVSDSEREEKTSTTVKVLVIYYKLARMTNEFLANSSLKLHSGVHYTDLLAPEEIAAFGAIFRMYFDKDGKGYWSCEEIREVLSGAIGINISEKQMFELVQAIQKSVHASEDITQGLSLECFLQWYCNQFVEDSRSKSIENDKKECAEFLFRMFDDDNSGDITVLEFSRAMDEMNIGISHEEADELLQELDSDGNGVLTEDEFEDLVKHFYPVEFDISKTNHMIG